MTPQELARHNGHRAYVVYSTEPDYGAVLVFAPNGQKARQLGFPVLTGWYDCIWTDIRANWLRDLPIHLWELYDGTESVYDDPPVCRRCETWGGHWTEEGCTNCEEKE